MSQPGTVRERVVARLLEVSDARVVAADVDEKTSLGEDLDLSSLQAVGLAMDLEDEFGIRVPQGELRKFRTVGDILEFVESQVGDREEASGR